MKSAAMLRVVAVGGEEEERHHEAGESHGLGEDDGLEDILEVLVRVGTDAAVLSVEVEVVRAVTISLAIRRRFSSVRRQT